MMQKSAGLVVYRFRHNILEVFLVHPGGPFWTKKDLGAWSIPKGLIEPEEDPFLAARREFKEETGFQIDGKFLELSPVKQRSGKMVLAWAIEGDLDLSSFKSNTFEMEWPRGSGLIRIFPEIDRTEWFPIELAKGKILSGQVSLLNELESKLMEKDR